MALNITRSKYWIWMTFEMTRFCEIISELCYSNTSCGKVQMMLLSETKANSFSSLAAQVRSKTQMMVIAKIIFRMFVGWLKRSLSQSIGSFSCNPHFALFLPGQRSDIFGNVSDHWGMVTYNFFRNIFFGSLIRTCTGSFANVCEGTSPLYMKEGQILRLSKNGSWALVDACPFFLSVIN